MQPSTMNIPGHALSLSDTSSPLPGDAHVLPALVDIAACHMLKTRLREALMRGGTLRLNASAVERIQTPGLQLLLSVAKSAAASGQKLHIIRISPALRSAIDDAGLATHFASLIHTENPA